MVYVIDVIGRIHGAGDYSQRGAQPRLSFSRPIDTHVRTLAT